VSGGIGVIVIGRNEGERLVRCLASVGAAGLVVYVDSGSTDGSAARARAAGAEVIELDGSRPYTAARGRNAGLAWLAANRPEVALVQLVDGDCVIDPGWVTSAASFLHSSPRAAAAFGRLRERHPDRSLYNRLCELEWNEPRVGEVAACGGIALVRAGALRECDGFREDLIAGEEPELCLRLRERGWTIHCLDVEMGTHDAAMTRFSQWWMRAVRAGHASAESAWIHRDRAGRSVRSVASALLWGALIPIAAVAGVFLTHWWSLLLLAAYPLQWMRLTIRQRSHSEPVSLAWRHSALLIVSKFANLLGALRFLRDAAFRRQTRLIEYKGPEGLRAEEPAAAAEAHS
jgi:GT2 family glycosyltransferase